MNVYNCCDWENLTYLHERLSQFCLGPLSRNRQICSILQRSAARLPVYQVRRRIILGVVASVGAAGSKICLTVLRMVVFRAACCRIFFVNDYSRLLHKKVGMVLFLADLWNSNHLILLKRLWRVNMAPVILRLPLRAGAPLHRWRVLPCVQIMGLGREIFIVMQRRRFR